MGNRNFTILACIVLAYLLLATSCGGGQGAPNVIVLILDTVRADHMGCYGYHRDVTPTLDSLGAEGTRWTRVQGQSAWTLPSIASMYIALRWIIWAGMDMPGTRFGSNG